MRILTVVGARPQFVKMAFVSRNWPAGVEEVVVHTGQHYDAGMSQVFFDELGIPAPAHHLRVGSGSHGHQTGAAMQGLEPIVEAARPDALLVYGDTNATLAGALVGAKQQVPVVHVEAGLRSFDRRMPEEVNRVVVDHLSSLLLAPTATAVQNLHTEGIRTGVELVGDVMVDSTLASWEASDAAVLERVGVAEDEFVLATVHRPENTDDPARLDAIFEGLAGAGGPTGREHTVVLPLHPRTRKALEATGRLDAWRAAGWLRLIDPVGHHDMMRLAGAARVVATDSGGLQKEAVILGTPCVTLRASTEWIETVEVGWNRLVGTEAAAIAAALHEARPGRGEGAGLYGGPGAGKRIAQRIAQAELRLPGPGTSARPDISRH